MARFSRAEKQVNTHRKHYSVQAKSAGAAFSPWPAQSVWRVLSPRSSGPGPLPPHRPGCRPGFRDASESQVCTASMLLVQPPLPGTAQHSRRNETKAPARGFSVKGDTSHRQRPGEQGLTETRWQRVSFLLSWHRVTAPHSGLTPAALSWTLRSRRSSMNTPKAAKTSQQASTTTNANSRAYLQPASQGRSPWPVTT